MRKSCNMIAEDAAAKIVGLENLEFFLQDNDQWLFHDSEIRDIRWSNDKRTLDVTIEPIGFGVDVPGLTQEKNIYLDLHFCDVVSVYMDWEDYGFIYQLKMKEADSFLECVFDGYFLRVFCKELRVDKHRIV